MFSKVDWKTVYCHSLAGAGCTIKMNEQLGVDKKLNRIVAVQECSEGVPSERPFASSWVNPIAIGCDAIAEKRTEPRMERRNGRSIVVIKPGQ